MLLSELWPPRINSFLILRLWPFSNHEEKVLTPIFFSFRKICLLSPRALAMQYIFMATASYGGEATTLSFEWVNVTIEYEQPLRSQRSLLSFTRYSSLLAFVCFGTSSVAQRLVTISSNCFEFYTKYQHVITLFFGATYCLSRDVIQKTTNISQSFQKGAWTKQALPSRNVLKGVIGASWKFRGNFFLQRGHFTVWIRCNIFQF